MLDILKSICIDLLLCAQSLPVAWEHGYRTDRVIAWRFQNQIIGYNIGFDLPKNPYDADRADMHDWLSKNGIHIFEGGGAPGAMNYAKVDGVTDRESANKFLVEFLPKFDAWIRANLK